MKKLLLIPLALSISGCGLAPLLLGATAGAPSPQASQAVQTVSAPLVHTGVDESAYRLALSGSRALAASVRVGAARGGLPRNSPKALAVQKGLIALESSLHAARSLLDALNDPAGLSLDDFNRKLAEYRKLMADGEQASADITAALAG